MNKRTARRAALLAETTSTPNKGSRSQLVPRMTRFRRKRSNGFSTERRVSQKHELILNKLKV
jgi:hypothetical protein